MSKLTIVFNEIDDEDVQIIADAIEEAGLLADRFEVQS